MTSGRLWRRELQHGTDAQANIAEGRKKERYALICVDPPRDMSLELAVELWPDMRPGKLRSDLWVVDDLKIDSLSTSEHLIATVDLKRVGKGDKNDPNPLKRPVSWAMETEFIEVAAEFDHEGKPLENTAHEPLTGLIDFEPIEVWSAVRYVERTPEWLREFVVKCTNSTAVSLRMITGEDVICEPETLKMEGLSLGEVEVTQVDDRIIKYREMPLRWLYRKSGWRDRIINRGKTEYFPPANPIFATQIFTTPERRVPCLDSNGKPVEEPVPLNKDGQRFRHKVPRPTETDPNGYEWAVKEVLEKDELVILTPLRLKPLDFNRLLE